MTVKKCEPKFAVASRRAGPKYRKELEALFGEKYQERFQRTGTYFVGRSRGVCVAMSPERCSGDDF